jgi:phospholipase/carboxylesterase
MRAVNDTMLESFENWTLRVRHPARTPARLMLMLHGWTGDENSMWVFARNLADNYLLVAPRGLHKDSTTGYSWRPFRADSLARPSLEDLKESADALLQLVDEYAAKNQTDAGQFDIMGFSQGAALTNVMLCLHPDRINKAAVLSGFMPSGMNDIIARKPLINKPVFVAHGTQDNMVPIDRARASMSLLEQAGAKTTYCEAEVGHKVSAGCLRGLEAFFA